MADSTSPPRTWFKALAHRGPSLVEIITDPLLV